MKPLILTNHGVKIKFNHGANLGIGIYRDPSDIRYAQLEYDQIEQLKEFLNRGSEELERRKDIINAGCERNNELREYIKQLIVYLSVASSSGLTMSIKKEAYKFIKKIEHELEI